jgi:phosphatidylinositol glycan class F
MEDAREILSVHLSSFLTPASLLLFHLLSPGGFLGTPLLALSLLSLAASLAAVLAPSLFLSPVPLEPHSPGPVKLFRHYVYEHKDTKRHPIQDGQVLLTKGSSFMQVLLASTTIYVIVGTLLGADPFRQLVGTVVWALLMTSLTSVPVVVLLDTEHQTWRRVLLDRIFINSAERGLYVMVMSTLLGAWLGAVPIPLDWNRPWQVWPMPCCCGAVLGSLLGSSYSLLAQHFSFYPTQLNLQSRWHSLHHQYKTPLTIN